MGKGKIATKSVASRRYCGRHKEEFVGRHMLDVFTDVTRLVHGRKARGLEGGVGRGLEMICFVNIVSWTSRSWVTKKNNKPKFLMLFGLLLLPLVLLFGFVSSSALTTNLGNNRGSDRGGSQRISHSEKEGK